MSESYERNRYLDRAPDIHPSAFVAATADVIGGVRIGARSSIWYQVVLRCDDEPIVIGEGSNLQDGVIVHTDPGSPTHIGSYVTVGHRAIVHGATIEDNVMIAIGAIVLSGARIGANSIVGAGAVVTEGREIPPDSLVVGVPGRVLRKVSDEQRARIRGTAEVYIERARRYVAERTRQRQRL